MNDIPILTSPKNTQSDVSQVLTSFNDALSFTGEQLNEMSSSIQKTITQMDKAIKTPAQTEKSLVKTEQTTEQAVITGKKEQKKTNKKLSDLSTSLKTFGTSISQSILGDVSFITQPFKQIGDITKKTFAFFKGDKDKRVAPKREVLLKKGVEGASSVFIVDWMKKLMGKDGEKEDGGINLLEKLGIASIASKLFPGLMKALPFAMIAGGILWGVLDGIWAVGEAEKWGVSNVAAFLGGFFGGKGEGWSNVLPNMGKGALLGAGIGMLAGGPIGAIAGALIGAAIFGVMGYIGAEKIAKWIDKLMETKGLLTVLGGLTGATIGFVVGGPIGAGIGGLIGMALGAIGEVMASEDPKATILGIISNPKVVALGGALSAGGAGFLIAGPLGFVIGMVLGGALGAIAGALLEEKARTGKTIKEQLRDIFIKPFIDMFQGFRDFFKTIKLIFDRNQGLKGLLVVASFLTGVGSLESQTLALEDSEIIAAKTERENVVKEMERLRERRDKEQEAMDVEAGKRTRSEEFDQDKINAIEKRRDALDVRIESLRTDMFDLDVYIKDIKENGLQLQEKLMEGLATDITTDELRRLRFGGEGLSVTGKGILKRQLTAAEDEDKIEIITTGLTDQQVMDDIKEIPVEGSLFENLKALQEQKTSIGGNNIYNNTQYNLANPLSSDQIFKTLQAATME